MALLLTCEHCRRRVKVSARMAGREISCPHCKQPLAVPGERRPPASTPPPPPAGDSADVSPVIGPLLSPPRPEPAVPTTPTLQPDELIISRRVVYLQAGLLLVVAFVGLATGYFLAQSYGPLRSRIPQPCFITGQVQFARGDGTRSGDTGAVALLLPQDARPDRGGKLSVPGLRPQDEPLRPSDDTIQSLRSLGGDLCRASGDGFYHLRVRDHGRYFLLFLSTNAQRDASDPVDRRVLAELGRYVDRANELLGIDAFEWHEITIDGDRTLNVLFGATP